MQFLEHVGRREQPIDSEFGGFVTVGPKSLNGRERNLLFHNLGSSPPRFVDQGYLSGSDLVEDARGVVAFDVEGDGDLDLLVQSFRAPARLLVNQGPVGHWLRLRLEGTVSNRAALGARIEAEAGGRRLSQHLRSAAGYMSGRSHVVHLGLGAATRVERLSVHWPSGAISRLEDVAADQQLTLREPAPERTGTQGRRTR